MIKPTPTTSESTRHAPGLARKAGFSRLAVMRLVETCPTGALVVGTKGEILYANPAAAELFGVGRAALDNVNIRILYGNRAHHELLAERFAAGTPIHGVEVEMRRIGAENFRARVAWEATQFNEQDAAVVWVEDVSSRLAQEEALERLFDAAPSPMLLCRAPGGEVSRANRRAVELFVSGRQIETLKLEDITGIDNYRLFLKRLRGGGFVGDFELVLRTAYGESFPGMVSGQVVHVAGERFIVVSITDITERKRAEETLRRFFNGAPLAMLLARLSDGHVLRINRRASELFDTAAAGEKGTVTMDGLIGPFAHKRFLGLLAEGGFIDSFEAQLTTEYGETFWAMLSGQIIEIDEERCVLVGVTDITDRKHDEEELRSAKDEAERATQAKTLFLATMSHEIRTPMNGVLGMLEVLGTTRLSEDQSEMVGVIRDSARTLLTIIDDILDLSKIESGKLHLEKIAFSLRDTVESTVELVSARAREKGLEVAWVVDTALPDRYMGDPVRLRQVMLNLLGNAVKFTQSGHVAVQVQLIEKSDPYVAARFEVRDTGIGLTEEQQARLFQPFTQADASTTRRFGGTGLGLSICRRLVGILGGNIGVTSAEGSGSTFWFEVPMEHLPTGPDDVPTDLDGTATLVVEDVDEARWGLAAAIRRHGGQAIEASSADEAIALVQHGLAFDAALIDDVEKAEWLVDSLAARIPASAIVPMSPGRSDQFAGWMTSPGLAPVISKPVRWAALARHISAALGRSCPIAEQSPNQQMVRPAPPSVAEALAGGTLILVAEDNPTNRLVIGKQLAKLGYACEMVEDGEQAWTALGQKDYALLLTDCFMPRLDGYELTARIRETERTSDNGRRLPIIALTANVLAGDADKCLRSGMDGHLSKPVSFDQLETALSKWLPLSVPAKTEAKVDPLPDPTGDPPVRWETLVEILGDNDPDLITEILGYFVETFADQVRAVETALAGRDRQGLRGAAHAAKGAARNAGAQALAETMAEMEAKAPTARWAALTALTEGMKTRYADVANFVAGLAGGGTKG